MNAAATKNKPEATPVKQAEQNTPSLRILKIGSCPSLSGKSTLTYHVGCDDKSELFFRVYANSSSGYFSQEWVSASKIGEALSSGPTVTSFTLHNVYVGKSQNNGGFMLAALLTEGLVQASNIKDRHYEVTDGKAFFEGIQKLIESEVSLDSDAKPSKPSKKKAASEPALQA